MRLPAGSPSGLRIVHHHPGRLRVRADAFVGDGATDAERTRTGLAQTRGVRSASHDARTGSLLIEYEPRDVDVNELVTRICNLSGLSLAYPNTAGSNSAALHIRAFVRRLNEITRALTGDQLDLSVLVPGGLAGAAVYSFFKSSHARLPRWDNLAYWAYSIFVRHARASTGVHPPP